MTNETKITPNQGIVDLAEKLAGHVSVDDQNKIVVADGALERVLDGTDVTVDTLRTVQALEANYVNALTLAIGKVGVDHMAANKEVESVSGSTTIGRNKLEFDMSRRTEVSGGVRDGVALPRKELYGNVNVSHTISGGSSLKNTRKYIQELAMAALGG